MTVFFFLLIYNFIKYGGLDYFLVDLKFLGNLLI